jgi:hypothetical protein
MEDDSVACLLPNLFHPADRVDWSFSAIDNGGCEELTYLVQPCVTLRTLTARRAMTVENSVTLYKRVAVLLPTGSEQPQMSRCRFGIIQADFLDDLSFEKAKDVAPLKRNARPVSSDIVLSTPHTARPSSRS